jgi:hypothetical protein
MEAYLRIKGSERRVDLEGRDRAERDLAVELSVCRAHGRSLFGAPPSELIVESQTHGWLTRAMPRWPTGNRSATTRHTPS